MGHTRLRRLPKHQRWRQVVALLEETPGNAQAVARSAALAADEWLLGLKNDESLSYCFWLLTRLTWAAKTGPFVDQLEGLGLHVRDDTPALAFIAAVSEKVADRLSAQTESGPVTELASLALRRALSETVGQQGRSLFGTALSDLRTSLAALSTKERFGELAQRFFGDFFARTLRSQLDCEIPNLVGVSPGLRSVADSADVVEAIDLHARESAAILREFAGGWHSKHNWESQGEISQGDTQKFVAYALQKLRSELKREVTL